MSKFFIILVNMRLPEAFIDDIRPYLPAAELDVFLKALSESEASCSVRINPKKTSDNGARQGSEGMPATGQQGSHATLMTQVPWCPEGRYLSERPNFTLDPRMHGGAYYVQEASSMFVAHAIRSLVDPSQPLTCLDLCAAPGGKSTAALTALPEGSLLVSNEIDRRRARILAENLTKWGWPLSIVTGNAPRDFKPLHHTFDLIITDVPCSGEGMFRKDEGAVKDWSPQKVSDCATLQREILDDIWGCLRPGGLLIYSTCTFNVHEDEEQLAYLCDELGAEPLTIPVDASWHIHPALIGDRPCYRFMPHYTHGEGLFLCAVRKSEDADEYEAFTARTEKKVKSGKAGRPEKGGRNDWDNRKGGKENGRNAKGGKSGKPDTDLCQWIDLPCQICSEGEDIRAIPASLLPLYQQVTGAGLYVLQAGVSLGTTKGKDVIPAHALALSTVRSASAFPLINLDRETALNYLRREAITLPADAPSGYVVVAHDDLPLGFVKNMGNRCNSLYPQEWRIRYV